MTSSDRFPVPVRSAVKSEQEVDVGQATLCNYQNRFMCFRVIARQNSNIFGTQCSSRLLERCHNRSVHNVTEMS